MLCLSQGRSYSDFILRLFFSVRYIPEATAQTNHKGNLL